MFFLKRVLSFFFFVIVLYVSAKHLGQDAALTQTIPVVMGIISLVGIINCVNPEIASNITKSQLRLPNKLLIIISLVLLMLTGDLSKLISLAETKMSVGTSVIKSSEIEEMQDMTADSASIKNKEQVKQDNEGTKESVPKDVADMTPEELAERKEKLNKGLELRLKKLTQGADAANHYYYSSALENKTKKNQVFPYLITTVSEDVSDLHMNLWIRYSYVGEEQLDLKKFKIITEKNEYLMDAYDVNIDRELPETFLEPDDLNEDRTEASISETDSSEDPGKVWEWIEFSPNITKLDMLRDMASSKKVAIHYEGKSGSKDRQLTADEMKALKEILQTYDIFLEANK